MALTKSASVRLVASRLLLRQLFEIPDLNRVIQALPPPRFSALVRQIGVEDAGELLALATTEQLVQAFDEALFVNENAGEREVFDASRFALWLEVLLEAGDEAAAKRIAELDEDFVAHAFSSLVLVLDEDALRERLDDADEDEVGQFDKALASALTEELDGYVVVAKQHQGWDALLALLLALDNGHRPLLARLLNRLSLVSSHCLEDLNDLWSVLTEAESLAEDVEAARETRRGRQGYVEPRAARAFLELAKKPFSVQERAAPVRDPLTRAYFREVERNAPRPAERATADVAVALPPALRDLLAFNARLQQPAELMPGQHATSPGLSALRSFQHALSELQRSAPAAYLERMDELAYLANVLQAGRLRAGERILPSEAVGAVLATVCFGAALWLHASKARSPNASPIQAWEALELLQRQTMDTLFREASSALIGGVASAVAGAGSCGLLFDEQELSSALSSSEPS